MALARKFGLTLDRAVSRFMSPTVDIATEIERTSSRFNNVGLISDVQPYSSSERDFRDLIWLLAFGFNFINLCLSSLM